MNKLIFLPICMATALTFAPRSSSACSYAGPLQEREIFPPNGTVAVPLNAKVVVNYAATTGRYEPEIAFASLSDVAIRPQGGTPIELAPRLITNSASYQARQAAVVLSPKQDLAANTTYEVLSRISVPCLGPSCEGEHAVISTFTTGTARDVTGPVLSPGLKLNFQPASLEDTSCGYGALGTVKIEWPQAIDDMGLVRYMLERHGTGVALPFIAGTSVDGYYVCAGAPAPRGEVEILPGAYRVTAIDMAGNGFGTDVEVMPPYQSCPTAQQVPGDAGASDTMPTLGGEAPPIAKSGGCQFGGGASQFSLASLIPVLMLLWRRRRNQGQKAGENQSPSVLDCAGILPTHRRG